MDKLTKEEAAWLKKLQKVLSACPSTRLGFYTIGDAQITVFDLDKQEEIDVIDAGFFCQQVEEADARLGVIDFPSHVIATTG